MTKRVLFWSIAGFLAFASGGFAQFTLDLTGVGDGANADGVYVGPYQGTITNAGNSVYSGYMICDDFVDESYLDDPWTATAENAGSLNGNELFTTSYSGYSVQQNYDAVAWLADQLLTSPNVISPVVQTNFSFAIWDLMDGQTTDPDGGSAALTTQAFAAATAGYTGSNVTVFTPQPNAGPGNSPSQEFLVVGGPVATPEPTVGAMLGIDLLTVLFILFPLRRYLVRA